MGKEKCNQASMLMWVLVAAGLLCQNLVTVPVMATNFEDQKSFFPFPDPNPRSPPTESHGSPPHGSGSTPSHGGGYGGTPPAHTTPSPSPSHGNCGTPPSVPTPSKPSNPPSGRGHHHSPPSTGGSHPSPPSSGGSPPTPVIANPPTPSTPFVPSPPFIPDPSSPFTCNYWKNHPGLIWGLLGWWGNLGNAFGVTSMPGFGASMSLPLALSNARTDGYGTLYREGTASLLNSLVSSKFPFTTRQVRESFKTALSSNKAAAAQGQLFKLANEGHFKPRN
ncbi:hypothetical protein P3X46_029357 [Hevea brasiliensis]|uniref:Protodermal factor 1 n=1 Tax=Hevea brasiliensis TaxID=3981 RepID=A0ABQ9KUW7_HEVBR|nr:protodermal factor 1 [Hevea brasiliensis]KAJ9147165.1 hypothetical protein P3X46_029357 [Hevea brasiliensis]